MKRIYFLKSERFWKWEFFKVAMVRRFLTAFCCNNYFTWLTLWGHGEVNPVFWWATRVGKMAYLACLGSSALSCWKRLWSGLIYTKFFIVWSRWLNVLWEQNRLVTSFWMSFLQKDKVGLCFRHHVKIFHLLRKLFMPLTFSEINLQVSNTILVHQRKKDGVDEANQNKEWSKKRKGNMNCTLWNNVWTFGLST